MMKCLPWILCVLVLTLGVRAEEFEYGKRPPDGLFDPTGFLNAGDFQSISGTLSRALLDDKVEVMVVLLDDLEGAPPEFVARRFSDAWGTEPARAVVLRVPDRFESPWIVPFGDVVDAIPPEQVRVRLKEARSEVKTKADELERLRAATNEAVKMLSEWRQQVNLPVALGEGGPAVSQDPHEKMMSMVYTYAAIGISGLLILVLVLVKILFRKPQSKVFSDFQPHPRFGAPYSGGNHAVIDLDMRKDDGD